MNFIRHKYFLNLKDAKFYTDVLMVYFFTGDVERIHQEIKKVTILLFHFQIFQMERQSAFYHILSSDCV